MYGHEILFPDFASGCCLAESPSWPHENDILVHPNTKVILFVHYEISS